MKQYGISFWNLENLFDVQNSPRRTDKLQRAIGRGLAGWDQNVLDGKINQLSSIIAQLNNGQGPDVLGICEVENDHVLNLLIQALNPLGRNYGIVHHDSQDRRGIDVAFIYDQNLFSVEHVFDHTVMRRTATRALLQVNFRTTRNNQLLVLIANHWPSRSGGQLESEGYRQIAGETLAYFHQRIKEIHGNDTPVLAMGDFNDEPFNSSLTRHALSLRSRTRVVRGSRPYFLNLMWPLMDEGIGSFFFNNEPNMLDQFLANENMLKQNSVIRVLLDSVQINNFPEMTNTGTYPTPIRYGMGNRINPNGFSDHFPISVRLEQV